MVWLDQCPFFSRDCNFNWSLNSPEMGVAVSGSTKRKNRNAKHYAQYLKIVIAHPPTICISKTRPFNRHTSRFTDYRSKSKNSASGGCALGLCHPTVAVVGPQSSGLGTQRTDGRTWRIRYRVQRVLSFFLLALDSAMFLISFEHHGGGRFTEDGALKTEGGIKERITLLLLIFPRLIGFEYHRGGKCSEDGALKKDEKIKKAHRAVALDLPAFDQFLTSSWRQALVKPQQQIRYRNWLLFIYLCC